MNIYLSMEEIKKKAREIIDAEGLFLGISSIANILAAEIVKAKYKHKVVVTVAPDDGRSYEEFYMDV